MKTLFGKIIGMIMRDVRFLYDFLRSVFGRKPKILGPFKGFLPEFKMKFFVRSCMGDLLKTKFRMLDSALKYSFDQIPVNIGNARIAIYDNFDNYVGSLSWDYTIKILSSGEVLLRCIPVCNGSELGTHRLSKKERKRLAKRLEMTPGSFSWGEDSKSEF